MTILVCYHFGTYRSFKEYYLGFVKDCLRREFPDAVSTGRFFCSRLHGHYRDRPALFGGVTLQVKTEF